MNQTKQEVQQCPFCPLWGNPDIEQHVIGGDFFGESVKVQGIECCGDCKTVLDGMPANEIEKLVAVVIRNQTAKTLYERCKASAREIYHKDAVFAKNDQERVEAEARYERTVHEAYELMKEATR